MHRLSPRAFTLIEVIVALALFSISMVVLSESFLGGMFSMEAIKRKNTIENDLDFVYNTAFLDLFGEANEETLNKFHDAEMVFMTPDQNTVRATLKPYPTALLDLNRIQMNFEYKGENSAKTQEAKDVFFVYIPGSSEKREVNLQKPQLDFGFRDNL